MESNKLITLIDNALAETNNVVANSLNYNENEEPILSTKKVLNLLKEEVQHNPEKIHERILRAMHDIGMSAYKDFENTPLENAIGKVTEMLYNGIPQYKEIEPLRMDFGKGNPI